MVYFSIYIYTYFEIKPRTYAKVTCSVTVLTLEFLAHIALWKHWTISKFKYEGPFAVPAPKKSTIPICWTHVLKMNNIVRQNSFHSMHICSSNISMKRLNSKPEERSHIQNSVHRTPPSVELIHFIHIAWWQILSRQSRQVLFWHCLASQLNTTEKAIT